MGDWFAENGLLLGLAALDGLSYAALVFMVAVGLNLVFGVLRIVNVAHGSLFAIGAYTAASIGIFFASRGLAPVAAALGKRHGDTDRKLLLTRANVARILAERETFEQLDMRVTLLDQ